MNRTVFPLPRIFYALLIILLITGCEKDFDEDPITDEHATHVGKSRVQTNIGPAVSEHVIKYIGARTNYSYGVAFGKNKMKLQDASVARESENSSLGIVLTNKEIVVTNEHNTKHTLKVIDPENYKNKINLIIVETETSIYEYFLKYIHDQNISEGDFSGIIEAYDTSGDLIGTTLVQDGEFISIEGRMSPPCEEDTPVDDTNDSESTGSSGTPDTSTTDGDNPTPGNSGGEIENLDVPCRITTHYQCTGGYSGIHEPEYNDELGGNCSGAGPQYGGSTVIIRDCNGNIISGNVARDGTTSENPCVGDAGVILEEGELDEEALCALSNEEFNSYYSSKSPFNIDLSEVRALCNTVTTVKNQKFMCVYKKLAKSPLFKNLFTDTFGENQTINVKFEIESGLVDSSGNPANGKAIRENYTVDADGNLTSMQITIKINENLLTGSSAKTPMEIAKTIIHECIHAYLYVKIIDCAQGSSLITINDALFQDLINQYFVASTCASFQNQHDFMANYMLPTFMQIMSEIKDDMIPQNQQDHINGIDFYTISQNSNVNGPLTESTPFSWSSMFYYLSLSGLHQTDYYNTTINSSPQRMFLKTWYLHSLNQLSKNCTE